MSTDWAAEIGNPEVVRLIELQIAAGSAPEHDGGPSAMKEASWSERFDRHRRLCWQRAFGDNELASDNEVRLSDEHRDLLRQLMSRSSPYRPRLAQVWQTGGSEGDPDRPPDLQGVLTNASLSHLGSFEVFDEADPAEIGAVEHVPFWDLDAVEFAPPALLRLCRVLREGGAQALRLAPVVYASSWTMGGERERRGQMTLFRGHVEDPSLGPLGSLGVGLGHQDLLLIDPESGEHTLFGLGAVERIHFPLDAREPDFAERARARGVPEDVIRQHGG